MFVRTAWLPDYGHKTSISTSYSLSALSNIRCVRQSAMCAYVRSNSFFLASQPASQPVSQATDRLVGLQFRDETFFRAVCLSGTDYPSERERAELELQAAAAGSTVPANFLSSCTVCLDELVMPRYVFMIRLLVREVVCKEESFVRGFFLDLV